MLGELERVTLVDEHDLIPPVDGVEHVPYSQVYRRTLPSVSGATGKARHVELAVQQKLRKVLKDDMEQICRKCEW
jgi:hypothetical protein